MEAISGNSGGVSGGTDHGEGQGQGSSDLGEVLSAISSLVNAVFFEKIVCLASNAWGFETVSVCRIRTTSIPSWHYLKQTFALGDQLGACEVSRFGKQIVRFRSSLDSSRLNAPGTQNQTKLRDRAQDTSNHHPSTS